MQLVLIFNKTVNKNKLKVSNFRSHRPNRFSAITKAVTEVGGEGGGGEFIMFFFLFLSVRIGL